MKRWRALRDLFRVPGMPLGARIGWAWSILRHGPPRVLEVDLHPPEWLRRLQETGGEVKRCYLIGVPVGDDKMQARITIHNDPPPKLLGALLRFHRANFEPGARLYEMRTCDMCAAGSGDLREVEVEWGTDDAEAVRWPHSKPEET